MPGFSFGLGFFRVGATGRSGGGGARGCWDSYLAIVWVVLLPLFLPFSVPFVVCLFSIPDPPSKCALIDPLDLFARIIWNVLLRPWPRSDSFQLTLAKFPSPIRG